MGRVIPRRAAYSVRDDLPPGDDTEMQDARAEAGGAEGSKRAAQGKANAAALSQGAMSTMFMELESKICTAKGGGWVNGVEDGETEVRGVHACFRRPPSTTHRPSSRSATQNSGELRALLTLPGTWAGQLVRYP